MFSNTSLLPVGREGAGLRAYGRGDFLAVAPCFFVDKQGV